MAASVETFSKEALVSQTTLPPPYSQGRLSTTSSTSSLPQYDTVVPDHSSAAGFQPTLNFQIDNKGVPWIALPLPPKPYPIPVYAVTGSGEVAEKAYESIRPERNSGNCSLYQADSEVPVCETTYRFGPNRPPKIRLVNNDANKLSTDDSEEEFEVKSRGCATRSVSIRTHMGTFIWRHANRAERRAANADSLLVLEAVTKVALENGKQKEQFRRVAQLVRNEEYRTAGTGKTHAGNGGRLMMDLREWTDRKDERRQMEVFVVASCITMLKREVDRRRMHQTAIMTGGGGGGGGG